MVSDELYNVCATILLLGVLIHFKRGIEERMREKSVVSQLFLSKLIHLMKFIDVIKDYQCYENLPL